MPTLETPDGAPVDVTPVDVEAVNAEFRQTMAGANAAPEQELPRRAARGPATDGPPAARASRKRGEGAKSRTTSRPAVVLSGDQRRKGVLGLVQLAASVPLVMSRTVKVKTPADKVKSDALKADAIAIVSNAEDLADACVSVAEQDPKFAAVLDKVCATGPYGALIGAVFAVGSQVMRNHRPDQKIPGTVHPSELLEQAA